MKIGIMTFWESSNNYGQLLQAFALQNYLTNKGHEVFFIKFYRIAPPSKISITNLIKTRLSIFKKRLLDRDNSKLNPVEPDRGFEHFRRFRLNMGSVSYRSLLDLQQNPPVADAYISGSDQVWNNTFKVPCLPFLLPFGDSTVKRIAYAASFGQRELSPETALLFKQYLPEFDAVSVREKSGKNICEDVGYDQAVWVPDPTLLFDKHEWLKMLNIGQSDSGSDKEHVFVYTLGNSAINDKGKYLEHVSKIPNVDVLHATANNDYSGNVYPEVTEWIRLIAHAKFVITNSFHGMVFCIIFNKNFIVLPNTGAAEGMNERIASLITKFSLDDHMMFHYDEERVNRLLQKEISWDEINNSISKWKLVAENFIESALKSKF